jgi:hypothetical protein
LAVLVISADFLASDFVLRREVPRLLRQHEKAGMRLFPVIVRDCDWGAVGWLARLQMRPTDARPLEDFPQSRRNRELANIAREVRVHLSNVVTERSQPQPNRAVRPSRVRRTAKKPTMSKTARG